MHQLVDVQTLVMAVDPEVVCELTPTPLSHGPRTPGEHQIKQLPMDKRAFLEVQEFSREVVSHSKRAFVVMNAYIKKQKRSQIK